MGLEESVNCENCMLCVPMGIENCVNCVYCELCCSNQLCESCSL